MKKLMFAAAMAACATGAFAEDCAPDDIEVARVYQMQMNVYTTKGVLQMYQGGGSACVPGQADCLVMRGKDKTVIRGYLFVCGAGCDLEMESGFVDSRRRALFGEVADGEFTPNTEFAFKFVNFIGAHSTDAEAYWNFTGTCIYDETRQQEYQLDGSGYGVLNKDAVGYFADNLAGYFAGYASASYDLKTKYTGVDADDEACACKASVVLLCEDYDSAAWAEAETVAFGAWKIKYNKNVSEAYYRGNWNLYTALKKIMK